jgi:hypothetical protein
MTVRELHTIIKESSKFKKTHVNIYQAVFLTGDFKGVYDYDAGILNISIFTGSNSSVNITTIDNGGWRVDGVPIDESKALEIIYMFEDYCGKLPNELGLKSDFRDLGLVNIEKY